MRYVNYETNFGFGELYFTLTTKCLELITILLQYVDRVLLLIYA